MNIIIDELWDGSRAISLQDFIAAEGLCATIVSQLPQTQLVFTNKTIQVQCGTCSFKLFVLAQPNIDRFQMTCTNCHAINEVNLSLTESGVHPPADIFSEKIDCSRKLLVEMHRQQLVQGFWVWMKGRAGLRDKKRFVFLSSDYLSLCWSHSIDRSSSHSMTIKSLIRFLSKFSL